MRRVALSVAMLTCGAALLGAATAAWGGDSQSSIREGGTFRIAASEIGSIDPALTGVWSTYLLDATCARLMTNPDKPAPEGFRVVPEVAARYPRVSADGRTYTFTIRKGFRFSNGAPVGASAFSRAINRLLAPAIATPGDLSVRDIVGAEDVLSGKVTAARGVVARGNRLVVRFTRPVRDFPAQTTSTAFCAVPPTLPVDPEGVGAFPGSGPYYIAEYVRGQRVVLRRNRFYRGTRPHHVDSIVVDGGAASEGEVLDRVERGQADFGFSTPGLYLDPARKLVARYGINRSQFHLKPGLGLNGFALNTSRPLFRDNARLRRAVNFAVDRAALRRVSRGGVLGSRLTDQYLPPGMPGYRDARIYPLARPDLAKARALARGRTRVGKAVLLTIDVTPQLAIAQILRRDLGRIGLDLEVKALPVSAYFAQVAKTNTYDFAFSAWAPAWADPYSSLDPLFDPRFIGYANFSRFDSAKYNRLLARAARLQGEARYQAYGRLDVQLARDAAPFVAMFVPREPTLVSKRVDPRCVVLRPGLDLAAVCLKR